MIRPGSGCFSSLQLVLFVFLILFPPLTGFGAAPGGVPDKNTSQDSDYARAEPTVKSRYDQGKFYFNLLQENQSLAANRDNWLKCINIFQDTYRENPNHSLAPASLYMICRTRLKMFDRFHDAADLDAAIGQLQNLVKLFPASNLADDALFALGQLYLDNKNDRQQAALYFSRVVNEYPDGDMYTLAAEKLQQLSQEFGMALPHSMIGSTPDKLDTILPARLWSSPQYGRVVVGASSPVTYKSGLLTRKSGKSRLYIDFADSYIAPADRGKVAAKDNGLLRAITTEQKTGDSVRVVIEAENIERYEIYSLPDPFRVIVDIRGKEKTLNSLSKSVPKPPPASIGEAIVKSETANPAPDAPKVAAVDNTAKKPGQDAVAPKPSGPEPSAPEAPAKPLAALPAASKDTATAAESAPPAQPPADPFNREALTKAPRPAKGKSPSLAQQLGLGVKRIVIDPGHGGKDPGAAGGGLQEKDVVLAVAKRLKPALEKELGCEVVLTRDDDHFLGLEERTAFANTQGADLFLSLHLNAHSSAKAHGFETYSLNLTTNSEAMRVAALENATSTHQLSDLQDILSSIMKNSKIAESSRLAQLVNEAVIKSIPDASGGGKKQKNIGVRQAPFYVLIGAQMPAILLEMAFISNPDDAKHITSDAYITDLTQHIAQGIRSYIDSNTVSLAR